MTTDLTTKQAADLTRSGPMAQIGEVANQVAADSIFAECRSRKAKQTLRRQDADLALFASYLESVGISSYGDDEALTVAALASDPAAWDGLTWGLVEGFKR